MTIYRVKTLVCVCLIAAACISISQTFYYTLTTNKKVELTNRAQVNQILTTLTNEDGAAVRNASNVTIAIPSCKADRLVGRLAINLKITQQDFSDLQYDGIQSGGVWRPRDCIAQHHVAIIIPYRKRKEHLSVLLYYLIPILKRQKLDFRIFVVEQAGTKTFNKGKIMNAGFKEASKMSDFQCFIFHDVDMIPEDDRNMYSCPSQPRHMSPYVDKFAYRILYTNLVGGVLNLRRDHFSKTNGFSNLYWGWGGEDDDMFARIKRMKLNVTHSKEFGRYTMIKHQGREKSPIHIRFVLLNTVRRRILTDGLSNLTYKLKSINNTNLFTHIMVDIGDPPIIKKLPKKKVPKKKVQKKKQKKKKKPIKKPRNKSFNHQK